MNIKSETEARYDSTPIINEAEEEILNQAAAILRGRLIRQGKITSADSAQDFLVAKLTGRRREHFGVILLDSKHQVIEYVELFHGTIDGASVWPREVLRCVLRHNAAAVILAHNHPSGDPTPSNADDIVTRKLVDALRLIDCRVLDHVIVGGSTYSYATHGKI